MSDISDNPAGRLRAVFNIIHATSSSLTVTDWWNRVASEIAPDADVHSVRSEAAALFRDVDSVAELFSMDDDREAYLHHRASWSQGIFSWGLQAKLANGEPAGYKAEQMVPAESVRWLSAISSILHRDCPDFRIEKNVDPEAIVSKIGADLRQILTDVQAAEDLLHPALRAIIVRRITTAIDDITFVRLRGWQSLHRDAAAVEVTLEATANTPSVKANAGILEKVRGWTTTAREICVEIERLVAPAATGLSVAIATSDVATGLSALITARGAIEFAATRGRELPQGDSGTSAGSDVEDPPAS